LSYKGKSFCPLTFGLGYARIATTLTAKKVILNLFIKNATLLPIIIEGECGNACTKRGTRRILAYRKRKKSGKWRLKKRKNGGISQADQRENRRFFSR
jgi:hypothetical protein